ncbi:MAG: LysR family transcriptional regulator [Pseudomonadota bacterium]
MDHWTEIRSAYYVAKLGTISAAADELKLHRATVVRHVDLLEEQLEAKLFLRHQGGYTPTDYGQGLFDAAAKAEESFVDFEWRMAGQSEAVSGDLIVTSTAMLLSTFAPVLKQFQLDNPDVRVSYTVSEEVARLAMGEAHVAIRSGPYREMEDSVMLPLASVRSAVYAHQSYIDRFGKPASLADFRKHRFVSRVLDDEKFPPFLWLREHIKPDNVVFESNDMLAKFQAIKAGIGIGFLPITEADAWPDMVEVYPHNPDWNVDFYLVTHMDLHRMPKVQALIAAFRKKGFLGSHQEFAEVLPTRSER